MIKNKWALDKAKSNIEKWYPVVGVLEDLQTTFLVLENRIPKFFHGITKIYYEKLRGKDCKNDFSSKE